mgnify:CR=1 FL=1
MGTAQEDDNETELKTVNVSGAQDNQRFEEKHVYEDDNEKFLSNRVYFHEGPLESTCQRKIEENLNHAFQNYYRVHEEQEIRAKTEPEVVEKVSARVDLVTKSETPEVYENNIVQRCMQTENENSCIGSYLEMKSKNMSQQNVEVCVNDEFLKGSDPCISVDVQYSENKASERAFSGKCTNNIICEAKARERVASETVDIVKCENVDNIETICDVIHENSAKNVSVEQNVISPPLLLIQDDLSEGSCISENFNDVNLDLVPVVVDGQFMPYIQCKCGDVVINCLTDAGSDVTLIGEQTWKLINQVISSPRLRTCEDIVLQDYMGQKRRNIRGLTIVPLQIGEFECLVECLVLSTLAEDLILGNNFLNFYNASLDYENAVVTLKVHGGEIKVPIMKKQLKRELAVEKENESVHREVVQNVEKVAKENIRVANRSIKFSENNGFSEHLCVNRIETDHDEIRSIENVGQEVPLQGMIQCCQRRVEDTSKIVTSASNFVKNEIEKCSEDRNFPSELFMSENEIFEACEQSPMLNEVEKRQLFAVLMKHRKVFAKFPGVCKDFEFKTEVTAKEPLVSRVYPVPLQYREKVREEIKKMLTWDVIEPAVSKHLMPLLIVNKKDGTIRVCVDCRLANRYLDLTHNRVQKISELLQKFKGKKYITSLDWISSYWQCSLAPECRDYFAFSFEGKQYRPKRVMFGIKSGVSALNLCLDSVFDLTFDDKMVRYVDDASVISDTFNQHLEDLEAVLKRVSEKGMTLNLKKCVFVTPKLKFLGHYVTSEYVESDPENVSAIMKIPPPVNVKNLRSLLGALQWHSDIVPGFAVISKVLFELLKKGKKWKWEKEHQNALDTLKMLISQRVCLYHPDLTQPFIIESDACQSGIACVLYQEINNEKRVVAYASRVLRKHEEHYLTMEVELLAILYGFQKWQVYLKGSKCIVKTDHKNLVYLQRLQFSNSRIMRWALQLQQYNIEFIHIPGTQNILSDYLSRYFPGKTPLQVNVKTLKVIPAELVNISVDEWKRLQRTDSELVKIINFLENEDSSVLGKRNWKKFYVLKEGLLVFRNFHNADVVRVCVPQQLIATMLEEFHTNYGHFGTDKTVNIISACFYWNNLRQDVKNFIRDCVLCQKSKPDLHPLKQLLRSVPSKGLRYLVSIDLIGALVPGTKQERYIFVVCDVYSRYVVAYCLRRATAVTVTRCLVDQYFKHLGIPLNILSDNGSQFTSRYFVQAMEDYGVKVHYVTPYNPRASPVERINAEISRLLRSFCHSNNREWPQFVNQAVLLLNYSISSSLNCAPCELHLNIKPTFGILEKFNLLDTSNINSEEMLENWRKKLIMVNIKRTEKIVKRNQKANRSQESRREISAGDLVFLKSYQLSSAVEYKMAKFCDLFRGPAFVVRVINSNVAQVYDILLWKNLGLQSTGRMKLWKPSEKVREEWKQRILEHISETAYESVLKGNGLGDEEV